MQCMDKSAMSEKILVIDLSNKTCETLDYSFERERIYGRGLVLDLFKKYVPDETGRYDPANIIALVPGLFTGNPAPSACRMFVATIRDEAHGIEISNTSGDMPQKLGSLGIAGVVIRGCAEKRGTIVHITDNKVEFTVEEDLNDVRVSQIVSTLRERYGRDCAVIGSGIAGDMRLHLSMYFTTYPDGKPQFHSPRIGSGDVWGAKNLRAVVVSGNEYFGRECEDPERFTKVARELTKRILKDPVCGGALPAYGSITIMDILANAGALPDRSADMPPAEARKDSAANDMVVNRTCAPMCVIGCLNRHADDSGRMYSSPSQVETRAAIKKCFGVDDYELSEKVQTTATEIGIVATEFVTACKTFAIAQGIDNGQDKLLDWLDEIEKGTLTGRVIASRTYGVGSLYSDTEIRRWIDRRAVQDEELFDIKINKAYPRLSGLSEMDLLYAQIFVLENLGFCIFTSFALLDRTETFELMAEMFNARTRARINGEILIMNANRDMNAEREYNEHRWKAAQKNNIPEFTKVLYRYFGDRKEQ